VFRKRYIAVKNLNIPAPDGSRSPFNDGPKISFVASKFGVTYSVTILTNANSYQTVSLAEAIVATLMIPELPIMLQYTKDGKIDTGEWRMFKNDFTGLHIMSPSVNDVHIKSDVDPFEKYSGFSYEISRFKRIDVEVIEKEGGDTLLNWVQRHVTLRPDIDQQRIISIGSLVALEFTSGSKEEIGIDTNYDQTSTLMDRRMRFIVLDMGLPDKYIFARMNLPPQERQEYIDFYDAMLATADLYDPIIP
jgi:hypothetical protein